MNTEKQPEAKQTEESSMKRSLKIGVLSRNRKLYSTQSLVSACERRGHEVRVIDYLKCHMNITSHRPKIYLGDEELKFDAVIPRIGASHTFFGTAVVRQFEMMNTYCVNESSGYQSEQGQVEKSAAAFAQGTRIAGDCVRPRHQNNRARCQSLRGGSSGHQVARGYAGGWGGSR